MAMKTIQYMGYWLVLFLLWFGTTAALVPISDAQHYPPVEKKKQRTKKQHKKRAKRQRTFKQQQTKNPPSKATYHWSFITSTIVLTLGIPAQIFILALAFSRDLGGIMPPIWAWVFPISFMLLGLLGLISSIYLLIKIKTFPIEERKVRGFAIGLLICSFFVLLFGLFMLLLLL